MGVIASQGRRHLLPHLAHEPLRGLQHQSIWNPQQADADGPEVTFLFRVFPHLTWLRFPTLCYTNFAWHMGRPRFFD